MRSKKWLLILVFLVLFIVLASGNSDSGEGAVPKGTREPESKAEQFVQNIPVEVSSDTINLDCRWTPVRRNQQEPFGNVGTPGMELICTEK